MKTIKDYLTKVVSENVEGCVALINTIIGDVYDNESGERIFDLKDKYEREDFAELYGGQTTDRLFYGKPDEKGYYHTHRYFLGGDNYYANIEDKTMWRCVAVRELTEDEIRKLLIENYLPDWEVAFNGSLTADGEESVEDIIKGWDTYYRDFINVKDYYNEVLKEKLGIVKE